MNRLTGQIITRPLGEFNVMGNPLRDGDKRVLVAVIGVVAVDPESLLNVEGRQFIVSESPLGLSMDNIQITVHTAGAVDRAESAKGMPLGNLLMEPIWRV